MASAAPAPNPAWFAVRRIAPGIWRIGEPGHVNCWLIEGRERAILIDSGLGLFSIAAVVAGLTDRPVEVANTHAHYDHIGGDREFERVAIHAAGAGQLATELPASFFREYLDLVVPGLRAAFERVRRDDDAAFSWFTPDDVPRALPDGFDASTWVVPPRTPTSLLADGDRIDLGGRVLEVLHTPGHTPDSVCLLLADERLLFTGDTITTGTIYAHAPEADVAVFAESTARLASELSGSVRLLCMAHHFRTIAESAFLDEVAEAFALALGGKLTGVATEDEFGDPALLVEHQRARIYLPDPARPIVDEGWTYPDVI